MRADQLEEAIDYRNRLTALKLFKRNLETWSDAVTLKFCTYRMTLSKCAKQELMRAIDVEEKMIHNTLNIFGIDDHEE